MVSELFTGPGAGSESSWLWVEVYQGDVWCVLQGSHVGPLLFNLFINDIHSCFKCSNFLLFADDLKLFARVGSPEDCDLLQLDLNRLANWCVLNGMELNTAKCHLMTFSRSRNPLTFQYKIQDTVLDLVTSIQDLGIILDNSLAFIAHIQKIKSKALRMLGFVMRSAQDFHNPLSLRSLYCSLVRSHLEYASSVWNPFYTVHIRNLERVQHRFLRQVSFRMFHEYRTNEELLSFLGILSLESRRKHRDLRLLYNVLNNINQCPHLLARIPLFVPPRATRSSNTFYHNFNRTNYGLNSFLSRSTRLANSYNELDFFSPPQEFLAKVKSIVE